MKVLVVGGGGREHALVWKIAQSPRVSKIFCAPGNAGITAIAECVPIDAGDVDALLVFALEKQIDLTVVGPEDPLSRGIVDRFEAAGLRIFGASQRAARIESSKSFAKSIMEKYGIPTARGEAFTDFAAAEAYVKKMGAPLVVKADGLAAGKGVKVCATQGEVLEALKSILKDNEFGEAGAKVVVEERLVGEEASFLAFTDGKTVVPLPSSQDHKAVHDNDKGPNTGGMGAYSPAPVVDAYMHQRVMNEVMIPMVNAMAAEGCPYRGVLYAGLMIHRDQIQVLEFNARFGDPETQPLMMRMKSDIVTVMEAVLDGKLDTCRLDVDSRPAVCVVMAAEGYPGPYKKDMTISGLEDAGQMADVAVFHAGTRMAADKAVVTSGGRVLGVTALGDSISGAIKKAYQAVEKISWEGVQFRRDIGRKALLWEQTAPKVGIVMGSDSDFKVMESAISIFKKFRIAFEITVASAHRSPGRASAYAVLAKDRGLRVIIAGAGHAAHLAGVLAAHTPLPVIGVPIDSSCLQGLDALLATVQMPPGVPVATMAIGKPGAKNAAILAIQILATADDALSRDLMDYKVEMAAEVDSKADKFKSYR
ncbi:phosphoribosylamine--glycine ligase [Desulfosarcina sp. OttesenSCG-928-G10]|nr:phosphoribosylamine--glycine ligase [Desulfosarcina sp. OttesenSCG-928-G10]